MLDPYRQLMINGQLNSLQSVQMLQSLDKRITELEKIFNPKLVITPIILFFSIMYL